MYGLINKALREMVQERFGQEAWESVFEASGVPEDSFLTMRSYDDQLTYQLVGAASEVLGAPAEDCLVMFGEYWVAETASKSYGPLMDASGDNLIEFLVVMGLLVPPVAGVYLADFFIFKRHDYSEQHLEDRPAVRLNAVLVALGTGLLSTVMFYQDVSITSLGALDSLFLSLLFYTVLEKLTLRRQG